MDSIANFLNLPGIKNSMTGSLPRAMLFVPNIFNDKWLDPNAKPTDDVDALRNLVKKKKKSQTANAFGDLVDKATDSLGTSEGTAAQQKVISGYKDISAALEKEGYSVMEMQYNPTTLRMSGRGGLDMTNMTGATDASMNQRSIFKGSVMTRMAVDLFFDQVNISDAFLQEGLMPTVGNVMDMGSNLLTNISSSDPNKRNSKFRKMWGDKYSVQVPVEGLMSLLQFPTTRNVIFFWSQMFFHGELTSVTANYTMFNKLGAPVRAKVSIVIEQTDSASMYESDNKAWDAAFDALFGEAGISQYTSTQNNSTLDNIVNKLV